MAASSPTGAEIITVEEGTFSNWAYKHFQREFIAGGFAGSVGIFVGFPFDLIKVRLQSSPDVYASSAMSCFKHTVREEGLAGLYKGCIPPICTQGIINALVFVGESLATKLLEPTLSTGQFGSTFNHYIAGSFGGLLSCLVLVPSEVVKCGMQTSSANGPTSLKSTITQTIQCIKTIHKQEGLNGFYKGFAVTAYREIPSMGLYFLTYKKFRALLDPVRFMSDDIKIAISGGFAGAASWVSVYPLDVIKTHIQIAPATSPKSAFSFATVNVAQVLYRNHGISVFFRGIGVTMIRAFPVNGVTFYVYEYLKKKMHL